MRSRHGLTTVLITVLAVIAAACGVPTGESSFEPIDGGEFAALNASTTTTSTTTTSTTTTVLAPDDSGPESTTTTMPPPLAAVSVYFIARETLQPVERMLEPNYTANLLIAALEAGPDDVSFGLESFVSEGLIVGQPVRDRGVMNVELDQRIYSRIGIRNRRQAIAQIVLTLTDNLTGVGQVAFFVDGEPEAVPTDRGNLEEVTVEDFSRLLSGPQVTIPTTTTTTTTTTPVIPIPESTTTAPDPATTPPAVASGDTDAATTTTTTTTTPATTTTEP